MLVLSRQKDESIIIGDDVEVIIVDVRGDKVRLGITAPKNITVHRREVYEAIQREKKEKEAREQAEKQEPQMEDKAKKEVKEEKKKTKKDKEQ
jgi:carbon storage regulator